MSTRYFSEKVVEWYQEHKRDLPWRSTTDPYKIWLSEVILQQTRVVQGLPYFQNFVHRYPTVASLAEASDQEVMRMWQGLGYYSRARNLHKCAKHVADVYKGVFPTSYRALLELPGVGEYTAAAIASFSAKEKVAVLDGNVFRVLSRLTGTDAPINTPSGRKLFASLASQYLNESQPDLYNQAVMDFGALWCTPRNPNCEECPFKKKCVAATNGTQHSLPVKIKSAKSKTRYFNYFVLKKGRSLLMKKRQDKDIWNGLFDFYLIETKKQTKAAKLMAEDPKLKSMSISSANSSVVYKHVLSHQTIFSTFIIVEGETDFVAEEETMKYYSLPKINQLPKPVLISRFLEDYNFL
jgi:A/G-specific adenine glycosylase